MRNRHVERSNRKLFFRIFGALAIITLIWVIFFLPDSPVEKPVSNPLDTLAQNDVVTIPAEVSDFVTFVKLSSDTVTSDETNEYASMGIELLSVTLESFIERNSDSYHSLTKQMDELKKIAGELEKSTGENDSEKTRKAFLIAADVLINIQDNKMINDVRAKAEGIQENIALEKQLENVKSYFISMADVFMEITGMDDKSML